MKSTIIDKVPPRIRYALGAVSVAAVSMLAYILFPLKQRGIDLGILAGFFETFAILKLLSLILLTALGISWLVTRLIYQGDNRRRTVWLLVKLGYGAQMYKNTDRLAPHEIEEARADLKKAGYDPEGDDWGVLWRYAAAIIVIGLIAARYVK